MNKNNNISQCRRTAASRGTKASWPALLLAILLPPIAWSQDSTEEGLEAAPEKGIERALEEVTVTGTRIPRRDFASPSPIFTLDRLTIEFSGQPTLEETLNQQPQVQPDFGRSSNNPGDGTSRINLRGLGADRTLVLLNGRRLAPSGAGGAVDVNNLPQSLVERVEIITGGATTVYGSDAIAGVVNFVTVQDYEGFGLESSYYITEQGDSQIWDINGVWGTNFGDGRGNVTAFLGYLDREPSFASDRAISAVPFGTDFQGNLFASGSAATPEGNLVFPNIDLGNGPQPTRFDANGNIVPFVRPDDLYNFAPLNYLQTPLQRSSAGLFITWDLTNDIETYGEVTFTRNESSQTLAPVPAFDFFVTNLDNPFLSEQARGIAANQFEPVGPGLVGFGLARRLLELGSRIIDRERDYLRVVAGLRGALSDNWDFDAWVSYTDGDEVEMQRNGASRSRLAQGLLVDPANGQCLDPSGGCVPVNLFGPNNITNEAADYIRAAPFNNTTQREQKLASAYITGTPMDSWAGPIGMAFGLEWRSDKVNFEADAAFTNGDASGYLPESAINGEESVWEIYGEALVPLLADLPGARYLGLELGARYSEYDNAGSVESWKAGLQWEVIDGVRFRAIVQRSVRAPNLAEAFQEQVVNQSNFVGSNTSRDPCSASARPVENGNRERCIQQGIPADQVGVFEATPFFPADFISGGNPALVPENADTFTAGVVLTLPSTPDWQLAVDYFDLEVKDTIGPIDATGICFDPQNTANLFCDNIRRDAQSYNVVEVFEPISNRGQSRVEGIDTQLSWTGTLPGWAAVSDGEADLQINLMWTYLISKVIQENPASTAIECAGYFGFPCGGEFGGETFPKNRATTNFLYSSGAFNANLTWRWISGTDNGLTIAADLFGIPDPELAIPSIGSTSYFDLGLGYDFTDNIRGVLNVVNLLDENPPFVADQSFSNNADTTLYDIFGRSYQAAVYLRF